MSLTGTWNGNDGSVTQIRELETDTAKTIIWYSSNGGSSPFSNIFTGSYLPDGTGIILGQWDDVPPNTLSNSGTLRLSVNAAETQISQVSASEGYGTTLWTKA
ncbi:hypothetical protein IC620_01630 [Hazenella sp. IB182357]|uniref:Uncharacterized protein n=1 Tax=Polycladospora coralii TaxID=2771432 RepID=A0A926NCS2_9BACL|nr:hypothetical protein [Polycladospora coralii]MBD1371058.1 hypothetical protein [Polycladospora coralii]MBS7529997.1 hypothetical protein [Polycladospora coralii]